MWLTLPSGGTQAPEPELSTTGPFPVPSVARSISSDAAQRRGNGRVDSPC